MDGYVSRGCYSVLNPGPLQEQMFLSSNEAPTIITFTKASTVAGRILLLSLACHQMGGRKTRGPVALSCFGVFVHVVSHSDAVR